MKPSLTTCICYNDALVKYVNNGDSKKMMQRDEEGYIISKLPETAVYLEGLENLVIPF